MLCLVFMQDMFPYALTNSIAILPKKKPFLRDENYASSSN